MKTPNQAYRDAANSRRVNAYLARKRLGLIVLPVEARARRLVAALRATNVLDVDEVPDRETLCAHVGQVVDDWITATIGPEDENATHDLD